MTMPPMRLRAVAFDIIETVFPLEPLRGGLIDLGLPEAALEFWFASGLRDAFALAVMGDFQPFAQVLDAALVQVLAAARLTVPEARRLALIRSMADLPCRPETREAFDLLRERRLPIIALSNGAAETTRRMLAGAGLENHVDHLVSVDVVRLSKPHAEVYRYAAQVANVAPEELALIAAHPWDINGAGAAGLITGYVSHDQPFSSVMRPPSVSGATLVDVVRALLARTPPANAADARP